MTLHALARYYLRSRSHLVAFRITHRPLLSIVAQAMRDVSECLSDVRGLIDNRKSVRMSRNV